MRPTTARTLAWLAVGLLSAGAAPPAVAGVGSRGPTGSSLATASLDGCHQAAEQPDRYAVFSAQMVALPASARMALRFDLLRVDGAGTLRRVSAQGLGVWQRSDPGVIRYRYRRQVAGLPAPFTFRAIVHYRWSDAHGHVVKLARRVTADCHVLEGVALGA